MCERCIELDQKIEQYRALARRITYPATLETIALLRELKATRQQSHCVKAAARELPDHRKWSRPFPFAGRGHAASAVLVPFP
jgi:hypothetical protein